MSDIQCRKFIGWSWEWNGGVHDDKSPTRLPTGIYDQMYREFFNQGTLEVTCVVRKSKLFIIASLFPSRGPKYCPIKAVWSKGLWLSCRFKYYRKFAQKGGRELFKVSPKLWTKASLRVHQKLIIQDTFVDEKWIPWSEIDCCYVSWIRTPDKIHHSLVERTSRLRTLEKRDRGGIKRIVKFSPQPSNPRMGTKTKYS